MVHPSFSPDSSTKLLRRRFCYGTLSFFVPFILVLLGIAALLVMPFGKHSLAITDAKYYLNVEMFFARLLRGEENFLFSFNNGLGQNEWSSLSWGGLAPASVLSIFASRETIPFWFNFICAINISLCGLTMYILLARFQGPKLSHLIFSTSYALMGYNVVNCYQTLFFIGPQILPLMVLGLIRLLQGRSPLLYILSLAACIFCNFYFGFMLCVASVILFAVWFFMHRTALGVRRVRVFSRWAVSSAIAGLLGAPMWLPALKAFSGGGRLEQTKLKEFSFVENMPFIRMFSKLFTGANSTNELVEGMPNIFCGILVVALVILYFMNRRREKGKKRAAGLVLGFYLLTFTFPAFTLLMHGGTHTNWFPFRYSFVFSFFLICLAAEEYDGIEEVSIGDTKRCGLALLLSVMAVFSLRFEFVSGGSVFLDFLLLLIMWLAFYFHKREPAKAPEKLMAMVLLIVVCGNLYANFIISTKKVREWELNMDQYNYNISVSGTLIDAVKAKETGFFRMEKDYSESSSVGADPYLYDYNGVSHSGPAERMFVHQGLLRLGIGWGGLRHFYSDGVPAATDALLGLKYLVAVRDLELEKDYEGLSQTANVTAYSNPNALSVAILANDGIEEIAMGDSIFENLNLIWCTMTGKNMPVFTSVEDVTFTLHNPFDSQSVNSEELKEGASSKETGENDAQITESYITYSFVAEKSGPAYVYDTSIIASEYGKDAPATYACGFHEAGETVTGVFPIYDKSQLTTEEFRAACANLVFAVADNEILEEYAKELNSRNISFNAVHENDLTGSFTVEEDRRILFTIPWDEGWTCYIDGQKVPIDKTWDLFMSVEAPAGSHEYEMKFFPAWMDYGLILGATAFLGLIVCMILWRKRRNASEPLPESFPADAEDPPAEEQGSASDLPETEVTE